MSTSNGGGVSREMLWRRLARLGRWQAMAAMGAVLVITALHYATAIHHGPYHDLYRRLYYVPIIYAAVRYGLMGGALLSGTAGLMYLPHLMSLLAAYPDRRVDNLADVALLIVVGSLTGALVDALGRKDRLAAIGGHASRLVHDVHGPMTAISLSARLIADPHVDEGVRRQMAALIRDTAERLADMSAEVLQYARGRDCARFDDCSLNDLVRDVAALYEQNLQAAGVELHLRLGDDVCLRADAALLRRALTNLLENAKEAAGGGGNVTLATAAEAGKALIQVRDTGPGIPDEVADTLFEPFVTHGKRKGTGLGLTIAKEIVATHGGELTASGSPGGGATFTISLPLLGGGRGPVGGGEMATAGCECKPAGPSDARGGRSC
ncbi:MAG: PAS domain-containing sensor histidine kinase [Armatimonadota bacterium]